MVLKAKLADKNLLNNAPNDYFFWVCDGEVLRNYYDLRNKLTHNMPDNIFAAHVNKDKNDFHNWVKNVFKDTKLAASFKKAKTKDMFLKAITLRIKELEKTK